MCSSKLILQYKKKKTGLNLQKYNSYKTTFSLSNQFISLHINVQFLTHSSHRLRRSSGGSTTRPKAWRWCPVLTGLPRAVPHHLTVDGTAHTIMQFYIELGQHVGVKYTSLRDVPDGCSLNNVPDHKLLDSFVFGHTPSTVSAADRLDVPTALLGTSVIPSLLSL